MSKPPHKTLRRPSNIKAKPDGWVIILLSIRSLLICILFYFVPTSIPPRRSYSSQCSNFVCEWFCYVRNSCILFASTIPVIGSHLRLSFYLFFFTNECIYMSTRIRFDCCVMSLEVTLVKWASNSYFVFGFVYHWTTSLVCALFASSLSVIFVI